MNESVQNVCSGLAIPQQGRCLFRCWLQLPDMKDAEQYAVKIAIQKLGIQTTPNDLTIEELCEDACW